MRKSGTNARSDNIRRKSGVSPVPSMLRPSTRREPVHWMLMDPYGVTVDRSHGGLKFGAGRISFLLGRR